ncbi:hypothetical protein BD410DRAFT_793368 [Rickenella mellea]|uniref:Homeobox domain-containing protein n=1 Tax=Rickenella mellea TaxID=50990 RepID=A0A4Y7PTD3_9AGAM|nr:hypothetical protein BD410DRAFT_793368 [Rickenella mellea]
MRERDSIATVHNILFTTLTVSLLLPKAVLAYEGQSSLPNGLDLACGVGLGLLFFWLGECKRRFPARNAWYFQKNIILVIRDIMGLSRIHSPRSVGYEGDPLPLAYLRTPIDGIYPRDNQTAVPTGTLWPLSGSDDLSHQDIHSHSTGQYHPSFRPPSAALRHRTSIRTTEAPRHLPTIPSQHWGAGLMRRTGLNLLLRRQGPATESSADADDHDHDEEATSTGDEDEDEDDSDWPPHPELPENVFLRKRNTFSYGTSRESLEDVYAVTPYPSREDKEALAGLLGVSVRKIHLWFQNKRASEMARQRRNP